MEVNYVRVNFYDEIILICFDRVKDLDFEERLCVY